MQADSRTVERTEINKDKNMRKGILTILLIAVAVVAQAQKLPNDKARVAEIRQAYTQARKNVEQSEQLMKAGKPANMTVVNSSYTLGEGMGQVTTTYYFTEEEDENIGRSFYEPYFIVNNYNTPGNKYYQEFLYDKENNLIFYFERNEGNETRFYFAKDGEGNEDGLVHEINTNSRTMEPPFASRVGYELKNAFHFLMNREF